MRVTYDKEADAMYIRLLAGDFQCRTVRLTEDIALDFPRREARRHRDSEREPTFRKARVPVNRVERPRSETCPWVNARE